MAMLEPPPHFGSFSRAQLLRIAAKLTEQASPADYTLESLFLGQGKLTVITGSNNTARSRYIIGMLSVLMHSGRKHEASSIWYFNRRWTDHEAMKALILNLTSLCMNTSKSPCNDDWIRAIEQIELSGLIYDNTIACVEDICRKVHQAHRRKTGKLLVVDGLDYFQSCKTGPTLEAILPSMLNELKSLSREMMLPVIASCQSIASFADNVSLPSVDYLIQLQDNSDE
jgi:hypothetical protein